MDTHKILPNTCDGLQISQQSQDRRATSLDSLSSLDTEPSGIFAPAQISKRARQAIARPAASSTGIHTSAPASAEVLRALSLLTPPSMSPFSPPLSSSSVLTHNDVLDASSVVSVFSMLPQSAPSSHLVSAVESGLESKRLSNAASSVLADRWRRHGRRAYMKRIAKEQDATHTALPSLALNDNPLHTDDQQFTDAEEGNFSQTLTGTSFSGLGVILPSTDSSAYPPLSTVVAAPSQSGGSLQEAAQPTNRLPFSKAGTKQPLRLSLLKRQSVPSHSAPMPSDASIPLIPFNPTEISKSIQCSPTVPAFETAPSSPNPDTPTLDSPMSAAFTSAPNSPNLASTFAFKSAFTADTEGQERAENTNYTNNAGAFAHHQPNPAVVGAVSGTAALLGVSLIGWLVWFLLRRKQRRQRGLVFAGDTKSGGGSTGEDSYEKGISYLRAKSSSPSVSLPDQFWKSAATPILPSSLAESSTDPAAHAWNVTLPRMSKDAAGSNETLVDRNSVDSCSIHSSFSSSDDYESTDADFRSSLRTSMTSVGTSRHSTIFSGGEKFALVNGSVVMNDLVHGRRNRSYTTGFIEDSEAAVAAHRHSRMRARTLSKSSVRSFGASLRSLKKPTREELRKILGPAPAKPPRSSLRPLTQLLYSTDLVLIGSADSLKQLPMMPNDHAARVEKVNIAPTVGRLSIAKARQSEISIYSDYEFDYNFDEGDHPLPAGASIRHSQSLPRDDSLAIDPSMAADYRTLTEAYNESGLTYYRSLSQQGEDDLQTNYASSIISDVAMDGKQQRSSVYTIETGHAQNKNDSNSGQASRRHTMAAAFPCPPNNAANASASPSPLPDLRFSKTNFDFEPVSDADVADHSLSNDLAPVKDNGKPAIPHTFSTSTTFRSRLPLTSQTLAERRANNAASKAASRLPSSSQLSTLSTSASFASEVGQIATAERIIYTAAGKRLDPPSADLAQTNANESATSTDEEVSDIWKLAQARVRARNSIGSAMTSKSH